jgi:4-hydroxy-3-polyprenylbenzoate decarboxylase
MQTDVQGESLNLTVATTGASGSVFLQQLLRILDSDSRVSHTNFITSDGGLRVIAEELGITGRANLVEQVLGHKSKKIEQQNNSDIGANVASGSYPSDAMIVMPCSMGTLGKIANGVGENLIERAADVCLKEKRRLVLCVREAPLNKIHIRNMYRAADAGATIFPIIPALYNKPDSVEEIARQFCYRVLQHVGLEQREMYRWKSSS